MLLRKKLKLARTQEAFEAQAEAFLEASDIPVSPENLQIFASFVQASNQDQDSIDPVKLLRQINKARANQFAFYMLHPERKEPKPEAVIVSELPDETKS